MSIETIVVPAPDQSATKDKKLSKEYGLQASNFFIMGYRSGRNAWSADVASPGGFFDLMQQYLEARQDAGIYMKRMYGTDRDGNAKKGYNNISFEIHGEAKVHRSTIHKEVSKIDGPIKVTFLSQQASKLRKSKKALLWHDSQLNKLRKAAGVPQKDFKWIPETRAELEVYEKTGGFSLMAEVGLTKAVQNAFENSGWQDYLTLRLTDSLMATSHGITYICPSADGGVKVKMVHPRDYDTSYIEDETVEPPYAGHYAWMSIEEIVPLLKRDYPGITDQQIEDLAKFQFGHQVNRLYNNDNFLNRDPVTQRYAYYDMMVRVFHFHFKSVDTEYYFDDGKKFFQAKPGKRVKEKKETYSEYKNYEIYCGIRLVGLEYVLNYGPMVNKTFLPDGSPALPYVHSTTGEQSIVQAWKPWLDEAQMVVLKQRALLQLLKGEKTQYDLTMLANLDFGHGIMKPSEVVRYAEETGRLFTAVKGDMLGRIDPSRAFQTLPLTGGEGLKLTMFALDYCSKQIMTLAGITPAMSSSGDPSDQPDLVGLAQNQINQTSNALFILFSAFLRLKKRTSQKVCAYVIRSVEYVEKSREYWAGAIGEEFIKPIEACGDMTMNQLGMIVSTKIDPVRKQMLLAAATESMKAGKNGYPGIDEATFFAVEKEIEEGSIEMAIFMLSTANDRAKRQAEAERSKAAEQTFAGQQKSAQVTAEEARKTEEFMANLEQMVKKAAIFDQLSADQQLSKQEHVQEKENIILESRLDNKPQATNTNK